MSFKCGIVGLPNVGKSTPFNALINPKMRKLQTFLFAQLNQT